ncbi:MAG TPA: hypothetical protein DCQ31_13915, partial [Bacteroidales bacterium]|nr:hypothetical protein [Bacteroidales bacterium]
MKTTNSFLKLFGLLFLFLVINCKQEPDEETVYPGSLPVVQTAQITMFADDGVFRYLSGGTIINDGNRPILAKGICLSTHPLPTVADEIITGTITNAGFTCTIKYYKLRLRYFVRAFATNSVGTSYGNELSFTTPCSEILKPIGIYHSFPGNGSIENSVETKL